MFLAGVEKLRDLTQAGRTFLVSENVGSTLIGLSLGLPMGLRGAFEFLAFISFKFDLGWIFPDRMSKLPIGLETHCFDSIAFECTL